MDSPSLTAARHFLSLLQDDKNISDRDLAQALDELVIAYHHTPEGDPSENDAEPPGTSYQERRLRLSKRFPDYGCYAVGDWTEPLSNVSVIADAIDDLADIEADIEDAVWRAENIGIDDAHWHFRFNFEVHWGRHLRQLSVYLFEKIAQGRD